MITIWNYEHNDDLYDSDDNDDNDEREVRAEVLL